MDDFSVPAAVSKSTIFVSWNESWDLGRYIDEYLRAHGCIENEANRQIVYGCVANFPAGTGMVTKVNMDFWLDSNQLPLATIPTQAPPPKVQGRITDF